MLGVLRREDDELALAPLRRSRTSPISSAMRAPPGCGGTSKPAVARPAGVDLTAYRVVQEALARPPPCARAAAGAWVAVRYGADTVELEVVDDGAARPAPMGMAERGGALQRRAAHRRPATAARRCGRACRSRSAA